MAYFYLSILLLAIATLLFLAFTPSTSMWASAGIGAAIGILAAEIQYTIRKTIRRW